MSTPSTPGFKTPNELNAAVSVFGLSPKLANTPADPAVLTSSTSVYKMAGLAVLWTPTNTGWTLIIITGKVANDTASDGVLVQIAYGTGSAPAKNAAAAGTQVGNIITTGAIGTSAIQFACFALANMNAGTTYWIDLAAEAVTGGNGNLTGITVQAVEI